MHWEWIMTNFSDIDLKIIKLLFEKQEYLVSLSKDAPSDEIKEAVVCAWSSIVDSGFLLIDKNKKIVDVDDLNGKIFNKFIYCYIDDFALFSVLFWIFECWYL